MNYKHLKILVGVSTMVLAATNVYWVFDTMRERKERAKEAADQRAAWASQRSAGGPKKAVNG